MNTLRDSNTVNKSPDMSTKTQTPQRNAKTPLRKEELEKIARELKLKLSKASVTAKHHRSSSAIKNLPPDSPLSQTSLPRSSPLKNYYMMKKHLTKSPSLNLSPNLYSPTKRLPTLTKPSVFLLSSPTKQARRSSSDDHEEHDEPPDSPIKKRRAASGSSETPQMVLQEIQPLEAAQAAQAAAPPTPQQPPGTPRRRSASLHQSPVLSSAARPNPQTTPTLQRKQLSSLASLLKTPTQPKLGSHYNDDEGADLLMYLATSPSPAKPSFANTPRAISAPGAHSSSHAESHNLMGKPNTAASPFISPPPPLTPKRPMHSSARTPQNRLTPSLALAGGVGNPGSALPSAGLALTPFNMGDYVNFLTPSPGAGATQSAQGHPLTNRNILRTPDFVGLMQQKSARVDGKMINFDKVGLFGGHPGSDQPKD